MSNFMDGYVDVATRLKLAFEKYPDLRIQETAREVIEMPDKSCFIRCTVTIWRTADDPIPCIATACEIYPGRTSFTKTVRIRSWIHIGDWPFARLHGFQRKQIVGIKG